MRRFLLAAVLTGTFCFSVNAAEAPASVTNLPFNFEHVQYWMKTLESHPMIMIRKQAARHLGNLQNNLATSSLIKGLSDANEDVRIQCAYSLGRLGDSSSLKTLYELIETNPNPQVKSAAKTAVDKINAHEAFTRQRRQKVREQRLKDQPDADQ